MSKKHFTALGRPVDMAAIRSKHELTRAVGNMNVNARGDTLDSQNNVIQDSTKRVNNMYRKTVKQAGQTYPAPEPQAPSLPVHELSPQELQEFENDLENPEKPGASA